MAEQKMQTTTKLWECQKKLGSGGFGDVFLYKNKENGEQIAIKRCKLDLDGQILHRWQQEINIMHKLNHDNVVRACQIPEELIEPEAIPLLGMEFCQNGDLRKVLNSPENVCGLDQSTVLTLAKHIASAVEYLHSMRVIHRDLKPENVIMQKNEDGTITYKLIDLGYAKDMDQSSIARTFVGTLQYLAPELFTAKPYTNTADYWSLGVLLFESICGVRPFLPNIPLVQWHDTVRQKKEADICVYLDLDGSPVYSKHLHEPFHLGKKYQEMFETFFRFLFHWDPKIRGGPPDAVSKRVQCFAFLDSILTSKLINVFCVNSQTTHSYKINEATTCDILKNALHAETGIPVENQEILFSTGNPVDVNATALQCWGGCDNTDMVVYLFHKSYLNTEPQPLHIPERVQEILEKPNMLQPYAERKKAGGQALFLCADTERSFNKLLDGAKAAEISMLSKLNELSRLTDYMKKMQGNLEGALDFFKTSAKFDVEQYKLQEARGLTSDKIYQMWQESLADVDMLQCKSQTEEIEKKVRLLNTRIGEIKRSPVIRQHSSFNAFVSQVTKFYKDLKKTKDDGTNFFDNARLVSIVKGCIEKRKQLTKDVLSHILKILQFKQEIIEVYQQMKVLVHYMYDNTVKIKKVQQQRQADMWNLLKIVFQKLHRTSGEFQTFKRSVSSVSDPTHSRSYSTSDQADSLSLMNESDTTQTMFEEMFKNVLEDQEKTAAHVQSMDWSFINQS
ncbi:inhibitor of nuclear factor kappa-B kinase subunit beta-like [Antedon mediterranea]|uniref:inhibitor of nuclear factor kappa-B kinase subunit beta-like n=1 Tax=Antedon mediterranea TaxID=105859 RepID=UPI003AF6FAC0